MSVVWLVDDSELEREVARRTLAKKHQVVEFSHGDGILEQISSGSLPDVLVIDYQLPGLSGLEITRHLRERLSPSELPVLVMSSTFSSAKDVVEGLEAGANDYVIKPFAEIELLARVEALAQTKIQRRRADLAERSLRKLLQHLPDAFLAIDSAGCITFVNREAERILAADWSVLLTQPLTAVIPELQGVPLEVGTAGAVDIKIQERRYEAAFGRLVIDGQFGETITISLRDVTEKLLAVERRDSFLAMLAHELRNPLAPILSAAQLLRHQPGNVQVVERASDIIRRQVERMIRIVDDLMDVSRVSRGRIDLKPEPVNVSLAIERAIESSLPLIEARRHAVAWHPPVTPLWVHIDPFRFEQMLTNLLNNAAKYTDPGGHITISTRADGGDAVITISDDGIGIVPALLDSIFELFVQVDHSLNRAGGGLGIGLPLVRQLAEMQGGSVRARSGGIGTGSEFELRLPATVASGQPAAAVAVRAPGTAVPRRVLLVDDNVDAVEMLAEVMGNAGHTVRVAHDGPSTLEIAREFHPEIVFLDIGLPGSDGYAVARSLRAAGGVPCLLVAMTGYGQPEDIERARQAGFDQHLVKPVSYKIIERILSAAEPRT